MHPSIDKAKRSPYADDDNTSFYGGPLEPPSTVRRGRVPKDLRVLHSYAYNGSCTITLEEYKNGCYRDDTDPDRPR